MSLQLFQSYFKKKDSKDQFIIDKRKFRGQMTPRELLLNQLKITFERYGITDSEVLAKDLMKIKPIFQLNKDLLVLVYLYFNKKDNDLGLVLQNFDEDFENEMNYFSRLGLFQKAMNNKLNRFKFRQDFVTYLFIIYDFIENRDETGKETTSEEYYEEEDSYIEEKEIYFEPDFNDQFIFLYCGFGVCIYWLDAVADEFLKPPLLFFSTATKDKTILIKKKNKAIAERDNPAKTICLLFSSLALPP